MTAFLERIGWLIHCIGLCAWLFMALEPLFIYAGNPSGDAFWYFFLVGLIWWPIRWILTGRTELKPIDPRELTTD
jgi:hypothetical protein